MNAKFQEIKKLILETNLNNLDLSDEMVDFQELRQIEGIFRSLSRQFTETVEIEYRKNLLEEKPWEKENDRRTK